MGAISSGTHAMPSHCFTRTSAVRSIERTFRLLPAGRPALTAVQLIVDGKQTLQTQTVNGRLPLRELSKYFENRSRGTLTVGGLAALAAPDGLSYATYNEPFHVETTLSWGESCLLSILWHAKHAGALATAEGQHFTVSHVHVCPAVQHDIFGACRGHRGPYRSSSCKSE